LAVSLREGAGVLRVGLAGIEALAGGIQRLARRVGLGVEVVQVVRDLEGPGVLGGRLAVVRQPGHLAVGPALGLALLGRVGRGREVVLGRAVELAGGLQAVLVLVGLDGVFRLGAEVAVGLQEVVIARLGLVDLVQAGLQRVHGRVGLVLAVVARDRVGVA